MHRVQRGPVAQGLEQSAHNRSVGGSIPSGPTNSWEFGDDEWARSGCLEVRRLANSIIDRAAIIVCWAMVVIVALVSGCVDLRAATRPIRFDSQIGRNVR